MRCEVLCSTRPRASYLSGSRSISRGAMHDRKGALPPLPVPPRSLTPPERKASGTFTLEEDTPARNPTAAHFAALASVFDELTPMQRDSFVELGFLFKGLRSADMKRLLDLAIEMNGLG
jgi:hypothetical protein